MLFTVFYFKKIRILKKRFHYQIEFGNFTIFYPLFIVLILILRIIKSIYES